MQKKRIKFQSTSCHIDLICFVTVLNVAAGKAPMQSSVADGGIPQKAVDGSTSTFFDDSTCTLTDVERAPWWYVNLLEPYMVQLVRIDFGQSCCGKLLENKVIKGRISSFVKYDIHYLQT